jgi:hypothetical protein
MRKIFYAAFVAAIATSALCSCSDFLDAKNKANIEAESYFSTSEGLASLRVNIYSNMKTLVNNTDLTEWGTDLYTATRSADPGDFHKYTITPENSSVESFYRSAYAMINNANCMLKYGANNPQYVAEAKFVRNYGYYLLTQQFGSVPYVTTYIETAEKNYPRTSLKELYDAMIAEMEGIINDTNLPATDHKGNVSQRAAKALLAKICLAAGWDLETKLVDAAKGTYTVTGTTYFQKAAKYAEDAINGQTLTMSFESKWSPTNEGNDEEIFSVQYERKGYPGDVLTGGHGRQNTYGSNYGDPTVTGLKPCSGVLVPSPKALYLWQKGDERYEGTFMTTIYNYFGTWGTTGYFAYYNASEAAKATLGIADHYMPWYTTKAEAEQYIADHKSQLVQGTGPNKCHVQILANPATIYSFDNNGNISASSTQEYYAYVKVTNAATFCVKKFDDPNTVQQSSSTNDYRDIVVLHLSDVYLTAAEAYLMMGNEPMALQYINDVRSRAKASKLNSFADYVPDYELSVNFGEVTPLDVLLDERARELFAETTRWMDLRRTRQLVRYNVEFNSYINSVADMSNVQGQIKWYRPIPAAEIATNTAISDEDQNQGY